ncbi:MAG: flagellin [Actinomycetota bacterium]
MRITSEVMVDRSLDRLHTRLEAYERSQSELATGRSILRPSDDPTGARRSMSLDASIRSQERFLRNASDAQGWVDNADTQLGSASDRMARARELVTGVASNPERRERDAVAAELREIAEEIEGIANTEHQGRPLFGGYSDGTAVSYDATAGTWVAEGGGDQITRRISDSELVRVNTTAQEWMGFAADGTGGDDLLTYLEDLATTVEQGSSDQISAELGRIDQHLERINAARADIGAATNRIDSGVERAQSQRLALRTELSDVEDVDVAEGIMEQQIQQAGYEATLQALSRSLPPSLMAFMG